MATVWRAVQLPLNRPVAIKFLHAVEGPRSAEIMQRFLSEARALAAVRHPNIVDIIDFGNDDSGQPYMVMELLEGVSFASRLESREKLSLDELEKIIEPIMNGLAAVHAAGLVHRDVKPENIYLSRGLQGLNPKLLDFGVSRSVGKWYTGLKSAVPTMHGLIVGTPHYMSPEQARGMADIDHRTDIYSVGVIIYEALTGQLPFEAEHIGDLIVLVTTGHAKPFGELRPDLGPAMAALVDRAMARDRDVRFHDMQALIQAFKAAISQARRPTWVLGGFDAANDAKASASPPPPPRPEPLSQVPTQLLSDAPEMSTGSLRRRRMTRTVVGWVVVLALLVGGVLAMMHLRQTLMQNGDEHEGSSYGANETVTVKLIGVPSTASVLLDGAPVSSTTLTLSKSDKPYIIEVSAPGFKTWRQAHVANADGRYEVSLEKLPDVRAEAVEEKPTKAPARIDAEKTVTAPDEHKEVGQSTVKVNGKTGAKTSAKSNTRTSAKSNAREHDTRNKAGAQSASSKTKSAAAKTAPTKPVASKPAPSKPVSSPSTSKPPEPKRSLFDALNK